MNDAYVTLDEVLAAAAARAASLVPEISGYLALALGDATARLPLAHDDRLVMLSTEGTVSLMRRGAVVSPQQAAREIRDALARLLAVSAGTMPGLASAARPREESDRGVDAVVEEIEAALIPVNRAAARRALARLSRETLRAREAGKPRLGPPPKPPEVSAPPPEAAAPLVESPPSPAPVTPSHDPAVMLTAAEEPAEASPAPPAEPTPTVLGMPPVESLAPPRAAEGDLDQPTEIDAPTVAASSPTPSRTIPIPPERLAPLAAARPRVEIRPAPATRTDVLLSQFGVSCGDDAGMREAASCLKKLAGLDPTPPPPAPRPPRPAPPPPSLRAAPELREETFDDIEEVAPRSATRARRSRPALGVGAALLFGAIVGTFTVARVRPDLLAPITARLTAPTGEPR